MSACVDVCLELLYSVYLCILVKQSGIYGVAEVRDMACMNGIGVKRVQNVFRHGSLKKSLPKRQTMLHKLQQLASGRTRGVHRPRATVKIYLMYNCNFMLA